MASEIVIPNVGESVTSGIVSAWVKPEGAWVERDEPVLELETDKITVEVPAPVSGVLAHAVAEGDEVAIGAVIGTVDESADKPAGSASTGEQAPAQAAEPAKAAASASTSAPPAPSSVATGVAAPPSARREPVAPSTNGTGEIRATPLAKKIAEEHGVDLHSVTATGAGHRVREQDVLAFMQVRDHGTPAAAGGAEAPVQAASSRGVTRERMTPLRQMIASRLVEAQQTAAMLTTFNECDMSAVMNLRKEHKEAFAEKHEINLGFMSFFVKSVVNALRAYPLVNASIVQEDGQSMIERHDYCDVAVAVSSPKGLVVPVLRNCEALSMAEIEAGIKDLAVRARDGKLSLDEMQGGTFTITNGGIFGSLMSTPILNPPQSAILGMHTIKKRAVEDPNSPGQAVIRPMMYLAVSYDHRIIDGAEAVQFLVHIKDSIEDPARLLLDL